MNFQSKQWEIEGVEDNGAAIDEGLDPMEYVPNLTDNFRKYIARLTLEEFGFDDDNEPAEKNIPAPT